MKPACGSLLRITLLIVLAIQLHGAQGQAAMDHDHSCGVDQSKRVELPFTGGPNGFRIKGKFTGVRLSEEDIAAAECILADSLARGSWIWIVRPDPTDRVTHGPADQGEEYYRHFRQYTGVADAKGSRLVWINAFCNAVGHDRHQHRITVEDGGDCYWEAVINLVTRKVLLFQVNGDA